MCRLQRHFLTLMSMRRSNHCLLPNGFLPAPSEEADASGGRQWVGETTDMCGLWLFLLCVLSENMVRMLTGKFMLENLTLILKARPAYELSHCVLRRVLNQVHESGRRVGGEDITSAQIWQGQPGKTGATIRRGQGEPRVDRQVNDGLPRMWSAYGKICGM